MDSKYRRKFNVILTPVATARSTLPGQNMELHTQRMFIFLFLFVVNILIIDKAQNIFLEYLNILAS